MRCEDVRLHLLEHEQRRLGPELSAEVGAHLEQCAACSQAAATERALTDLLETRLPRYPAPAALKARLAAQWALPTGGRRARWDRWSRLLAPALAVAILLLVTIPLYYEQVVIPEARTASALVTEAVNDHLRILLSEHPLDVDGAGLHQIKPWLVGRLGFAPDVSFAGDQDISLKGGAIGYFLDRKAAAIVYSRRLHPVSLFVFRADGLPWPTRELEPMGSVQTYSEAERGYNVLMWQAGGLCYALVSDLDAQELFDLGLKIAGRS